LAGRTEWSRTLFGLPKAHGLDGLCVGNVDAVANWWISTLNIKATGRGAYQRTRLTADGFPRGFLTRLKLHYGFQTGDFVCANARAGKKAGVHVGRVALQASGSLNIQKLNDVVQSIWHRYCTRI
jgi:hypothetical protein